MKQINFTMSFTCTDDHFMDDKVQNMISDQWTKDLIQSANESGFEEVTAKWNVEGI